MSEEVEFKNDEELKKTFLTSFMDAYMKHTGLNADEIVLVEAKDDDGNKIYFFGKKTEKK